MTAGVAALPDDDVRDRIREDLDATLFVDAGAGSGKTTVLVERIVALVASGVPLQHIAAVTFTEKAGAELRDRLREALETHDLGEALGELDGAAMGTLHSFARRILSEHPLAAELPPMVEVLDEVASGVASDRAWNELQIALLDDEEIAPLLRLGFAADLKLDHLRELVTTLESSWDLVEERLAALPTPALPRVDITEYLQRARALAARRRECTDPDLAARFDQLDAWLRQAEAAEDEAQLLDLVDEIPSGTRSGPRSLTGEFTALSKAGKEEQARVAGLVIECLLPRLATEVLEAAEERRRSGRLRFHDLLVLSRRLVRSTPEARASLQDRYRRLLLDEAQDTDPIQVELAVRIAGGAAADGPWESVAVPPGALFLVGDAKQSIYRFRRADIRTYLAAQSAIGETVALTTNFRSSPEVLDWINRVFDRLIVGQDGAQPQYRALDVAPGRAAGGSVTTIGAPAARTALDLRRAEAEDIAGLIVTSMTSGWTVADRRHDWAPRPLQLDDVTVLLPSRLSISALESALDAANVPYRTEAASIVYSADEVRELMACLRAVDDPTDELAVVATLRSSLFGCSDRELWRWKAAGGSWNLFATRTPGPRVADALDQLRRWSAARASLSPAELLGEIIEQRRVLEVVVDSPKYREMWRRLRFVVDQARAWSEAERGSLREYLAWAGRQAEDKARVTETVLPETDTSTVRITTIHASKGLQFPFVIIAGLGSKGFTGRPTVLWPDDDGCEVQLLKKLRTAGYEDADVVEQRIDHAERIRLLYVACTRAESHLAVSLHRSKRKELTPASVLASGCSEVPSSRFSAPGPLALPATEPAPAPLVDWEEWSAAHAVVVERSRAREAYSATAIAHGEVSLPSFPPGLAKDPVDLELPPWRKGRYGDAVGRAVHAVLQTVDLLTGDGLRLLAESQALAEGVEDEVDDVEAAARSALATELMQRAATRPHWRETYVGTVVDGELVEGYIDLLFRDDDGLVLVDHKTDGSVTSETLAAYERQLRVYRRLLVDAVSEPVVRTVLLFLRPDGAVTHLVPERPE